MTHIVWTGYVREQMHWAERLAKIAEETENGSAETLRAQADRALINAGIALGQEISDSDARRS